MEISHYAIYGDVSGFCFPPNEYLRILKDDYFLDNNY